MTLCTFTPDDGVWVCRACGRRVRSRHGNIRAACRAAPDYADANATLQAAAHGRGPGTELKRLLAGVGITAEAGCACERHARQMNLWGPDECERRLEEIVGWLRQEASKRGLPFVDVLGRAIVRRAIRAARRALPTPS